MEDHHLDDESRRKRVKLSTDDQATAAQEIAEAVVEATTITTATAADDAQALKEAEVGITEFVCPDVPGFSGILKKRYTDFLVNEILQSGKVLHLRNLNAPTALRRDAPKPAEQPVKNAAAETQPEAITVSQEQAAATEDTPTPNPTSEVLSSEAAKAVPEITDEDQALLSQLLSAPVAEKLLKLHRRTLAKPHLKAGELGRVKTEPVAEKDTRTTIHQTLRRVFQGRLESSTENDNTLIISAVPARRLKQQTKRGGDGSVVVDNRRGKLGWSEVGGEFLHFTIYKENKDTMEVINFLGRQMKLGVKGFKFAGTKDRRGVTVQRASLFRVDAARLAGMNRSLRNAVVGDFEYQPQGLELGDLCGNEFVITLRDCQFPVDLGSDPVMAATDLVSVAIRNLREKGYFNYYGLQRFGTFATRTDTVGVKMLQGDFKGACESILHYTAASLAAAQGQNATNGNSKVMLSSDDIARAEAIHIFQTTGNAARALEKLPRRFSAEANIIRHLGRKQNDYVGALQTIPRNLRLMYVHAYQSLVWNFALGERWRLYGDKVVEGDLVLVNEFKEQDGETSTGAHRVGEDVDTTVDADGEAIILPDSTGDGAVSADSVFERARALTAEEAASGRYGIFDIVLPLPGYDIIYPPNAVGEFYKSFMASERGGGLDPYDMRRKWKDVSLSGGYRKMMSRMGEKYMFEVRKYTDDNEQFVKTDLDRLRRREKKNAGKGEGVKGQEGEKDSDEDSSSDEMEEVTQEDNKEGEKDAEMEDENEAGEEEEEEDKLAVIIKFQLGASQYATMALRELMKTGGTKEYKPEYLGGR